MIRKLFFIIFLTSLILPAFAQKRELLARPWSSELRSGTVIQFLEELNSGKEIIVQYATNIIDGKKHVVLEGTESTVGAVLRKVLAGQKVKVLEKNNKLLLVKSESEIKADDLVPVFTFYGFVREQSSSESLIGATILEESSGKGVATNNFGYFSLLLPEGRNRIQVSYIGFNPQIIEINLVADMRYDVTLSVKQQETVLDAVVIPTSENNKKNGGVNIGSRHYDSYNYLMGEDDPLRSAFLMPGVLNIPSSFNGMYVRGSGADENLFLMDGNKVFNPTHILGVLSIVNHTSMKSMQLFKSDFPSKYAGATSSVIDVYTKDGNMQQWRGEAEIGVLSGSFTIEGPGVKDKMAVMGSLRHSLPPAVTSVFQKGVKSDFYDMHLKATQVINKNNSLMLNFYNGQDVVRQELRNEDNLTKWGNLIGSAVWNRVFGSRSFLNTSINMTRYKSLSGLKFKLLADDDQDNDDDDEVLDSATMTTLTYMQQYSLKTQGEIYLNTKAKLNFGAELSHTIISPFDPKFSEDLDDDEGGFASFPKMKFNELSVYGEGEFKIGNKLLVRPGTHVSAYRYSNYSFLSVEPRFFTSYKVAPGHQIFGSFARMTQYLHLVSNSLQTINSDLWVPSTSMLLPEQSCSYNLGYEFSNRKGVKVSVEGYWKTLRNVTDYADGKSYLTNNEGWEQSIITGKGCAYGMEAMIRKTNGDLTFVTSYALAWSWRQFENINQGEKFPYKYDRRHALNIGAGYKAGNHFGAVALWTFSSGDAFSLPDYVYPDYDRVNQIISPEDLLKDYRFVYNTSQHNQYRTSPYNRLDFAFTYNTDKSKKSYLSIIAGVYNIFSSPDQYVYTVKGSATSVNRVVEDGFMTFDRTPYITFSFKF
ncbi:MAG: TonB-dependent receptor [Chitinophagaceae bacterium]|nr:TonB-dependent receptor [Chitinophagaceae bacterium]